MPTKELAKQVIDQLPDDATMDEVMQALYVAAKCERGLQAYRDGDYVTQEEAKKRMSKWLG